MCIVRKLSKAVVRVEIFAAALLVFAIFALILANIVSRTFGHPIYWVNEIAVLAMIWMAFLGASTAVHFKTAVAVTMIIDAVSPKAAIWLSFLIDLIIVGFCAFLLWSCWMWFQPLELISAGFDRRTFSQSTFNFIYSERLTTINLQKFWFWLIVPVFAATSFLHAVSNLISEREPIGLESTSAKKSN